MSKTNLYKGSLQTILLRLLQENGKMYGYEITQKVKQLTNNELALTEGALYPALHKLEAEGFLEVELVRVDNRLRKYYRLTPSGALQTNSKMEELLSFIENMQFLLKKKLA